MWRINVSFCTCQETANVTYSLDELYLEPKNEEENMPLLNSKSIETYHFENNLGFKTYEIPSLRVVVHGSDILNYQGTKHSPDEIASYWKKDARTWLWKSENLISRRKNKLKNFCSSFSKI